MTILVPPYVQANGASRLVEAVEKRRPDLDIVRGEEDGELHATAHDAEIVVTGRLPDDLLDATQNLKWVQALSAGTDFFDHDALNERGIALTTVSGIHAKPIGQQVLGYLLFFERRFDRAVTQQHRHKWERYLGRELGDRTVGIVGVGAIGSAVAEYCEPFGTRLVGVKRDLTDVPDSLDTVHTTDSIDDVLAESDYLVVACPLTDETERMIDADALAILPDHAVLVNIARGAIVDQDALFDALRTGGIRGAALDVFEEEPLPKESPLWDREDVLVTPHVAGTTPHYWDRAAELFLDNLDRYRAGDVLRNRMV